MKFLTKTLMFLSILFGCTLLASPLSDAQGAPSKALMKLLVVEGIEGQTSWEEILEATQKEWRRQGGHERWEVAPRKDTNPKLHFDLFKQLGMTEGNLATNHYDYIVILGSTLESVRQRLGQLKVAWEKGLRGKHLVFLTGDRPLDPKIESVAALLEPTTISLRKGWKAPSKLPQNETEMMKLVFDQMELPQGLRKLPLTIVDTPKPEGKSRPTTLDTLYHWLILNPKPGTVLMITQQPFFGRTQCLADRILVPYGFTSVVAGQGVSFEEYSRHPLALTIYLDELSRWIYEYASVHAL